MIDPSFTFIQVVLMGHLPLPLMTPAPDWNIPISAAEYEQVVAKPYTKPLTHSRWLKVGRYHLPPIVLSDGLRIRSFRKRR